jgi:hypothetical protein
VRGARAGAATTERDRYLVEDWTDMYKDSDFTLPLGTRPPRPAGVVRPGPAARMART